MASSFRSLGRFDAFPELVSSVVEYVAEPEAGLGVAHGLAVGPERRDRLRMPPLVFVVDGTLPCKQLRELAACLEPVLRCVPEVRSRARGRGREGGRMAARTTPLTSARRRRTPLWA